MRRTPPLLSQEFADGPPQRKISTDGVRRRMDNRLRRYIVFAASEDMSGGAISDDLGVGRSTVYDFLKRLENDTQEFVRYGIVVQLLTDRSGRGTEWFCRICGSLWRKPGPAGLHAWMHLFEVPGYARAQFEQALAEDGL